MRKVSFLLALGVLLLISSRTLSAQGEFLEEGALLTLDQCLDEALKDHAQLRRAQARLEKEEALLRAAKREFFPKLMSDIYAAVASGPKRAVLFWTPEIRLPVFEGWRGIHEIRRKKLGVEEEKLRLKETRLELAYQVKVIYIGLLKEKELTRTAQEWVGESERLHLAITELFERELVRREELFRSKRLEEEARFELLKHKEGMDYGEAILRDLTGIEPGERIELEPLGEIIRDELDFESLLQGMKSQNPFYQLAGLRVSQREEEKKVLRSERFPKLSLSTRFHVARDTFIDQNRFELGLLGSWNVWDFGLLGEKIKAKEAEVHETIEDGVIETQKLEQEARKILSELRILWEKVRARKSLLQDKKETYQNERTRVIVSEKGELEIFDSFLDLTRAQMSLIEALSEYRLLQARLEKIRGHYANEDAEA